MGMTVRRLSRCLLAEKVLNRTSTLFRMMMKRIPSANKRSFKKLQEFGRSMTSTQMVHLTSMKCSNTFKRRLSSPSGFLIDRSKKYIRVSIEMITEPLTGMKWPSFSGSCFHNFRQGLEKIKTTHTNF